MGSYLVAPVVPGHGLDEAQLGVLLFFVHQGQVSRGGEAAVGRDGHVVFAALLGHRVHPVQERVHRLRPRGGDVHHSEADYQAGLGPLQWQPDGGVGREVGARGGTVSRPAGHPAAARIVASPGGGERS